MSDKQPKKLNVFLQCVLAFFPIVNLVAFYRIHVVWKGLLIFFLTLFLFMMFTGSVRENATPNYLAYIMGKQPLATEAEGYAPDYYLGSAIAQFSLLILPFALPVWFVRKWTKKWNANIDKQNIPTTDD